MPISVTVSGDFRHTEGLLRSIKQRKYMAVLNRYGQMGVQALANATPKRSGKTASSWTFKTSQNRSGVRIDWLNTNVNEGANIAILIQYGHGTGTGGYVEGIDYINPAIKGTFDDIAKSITEELRKI